jgi:hypothetical protein
VQRERRHDHRYDRHQPGDQAVPALLRVEGALEAVCRVGQNGEVQLAVSERTPLLEDQRSDDRDDAHDADGLGDASR